MSFEAIVLAGGLGTRLRSVVADVPKVLAPINGRPFIELLLDRLIASGCHRVVLATGYKRDEISRAIGIEYKGIPVIYSEELEPLGTGGAALKALVHVAGDRALVVNGDTWLDVDYVSMIAAHMAARAKITIALTHVDDIGRYGAVVVQSHRVVGFIEKGMSGAGLINGGVYVVDRSALAQLPMPTPFSLENDLIARHVSELRPLAFEVHGRFIDIGVPHDYAEAQALFAQG